MKIKITTIILIVFGVLCSYSQTKEELEKIKRMQDSMMNLPQMKDMMQQMKAMQDKQKAEKLNHKSVENKIVQKKTNNNDNWYWKNTIASKKGKFVEWTGGKADITMLYKGDGLNTFKIGTIKADGDIVFNLPQSVTTKTSLEQQLGPQGLIFDIYGNTPVNFINKESAFVTNMSLPILRYGKQIGNLTMGNSVKVTKNLTNQSTLDSGDEGYILYWAYAEKNCGITLNQNWEGDVRKDGTNTIKVNTHVSYILNFKPGWNLIKTEVIGKYKLDHERGLDVSWFKNHKHTIISSIPNDVKYYYVSIPQY